MTASIQIQWLRSHTATQHSSWQTSSEKDTDNWRFWWTSWLAPHTHSKPFVIFSAVVQSLFSRMSKRARESFAALSSAKQKASSLLSNASVEISTIRMRAWTITQYVRPPEYQAEKRLQAWRPVSARFSKGHHSLFHFPFHLLSSFSSCLFSSLVLSSLFSLLWRLLFRLVLSLLFHLLLSFSVFFLCLLSVSSFSVSLSLSRCVVVCDAVLCCVCVVVVVVWHAENHRVGVVPVHTETFWTYTRGRFGRTHGEEGGCHRQFCLPKFCPRWLSRASEVQCEKRLRTTCPRILQSFAFPDKAVQFQLVYRLCLQA